MVGFVWNFYVMLHLIFAFSYLEEQYLLLFKILDLDTIGEDEEGEGIILQHYPWEGSDRDYEYEEVTPVHFLELNKKIFSQILGSLELIVELFHGCARAWLT